MSVRSDPGKETDEAGETAAYEEARVPGTLNPERSDSTPSTAKRFRSRAIMSTAVSRRAGCHATVVRLVSFAIPLEVGSLDAEDNAGMTPDRP